MLAEALPPGLSAQTYIILAIIAAVPTVMQATQGRRLKTMHREMAAVVAPVQQELHAHTEQDAENFTKLRHLVIATWALIAALFIGGKTWRK